jgi:energy-converting hydrogenase Eha subunit F
MSFVRSNLDSMIFVLPLLGLLISAFLRVDELASKPLKQVRQGRQMAGYDQSGNPHCPDPDGTIPRRNRHMFSERDGR